MELKFGGGPFGDWDPKAKCKEVSRTKNTAKIAAELKFLRTKMGGLLGDEDPKSKCKEVRGTKMQLKFVVELKF